MKILVTGALGHIGSYLIRSLPKLIPGSSFVLVDDFTTQRYASLFNLPEGVSYRFHELDVCKADISPLVAESDVVIHLAAITDATSSVQNPQLMERNWLATQAVAGACIKHSKPILFSSSTSVYGTQKEVVDEQCSEEDLKPQSPYAETKLREERYLQRQHAERGLLATIVRFGTICGVSPGMRFHTAVNKFCFQAVMNQPITIWKTAMHQRRPYLELHDASRAVAHLISRRIFNGEVYNIVTDNSTPDEIVSMIRREIPELAIKLVDSPIMNQLSYHVSSDKLKATAFQFEGSISGAVKDTIGWLRNSNNG